VVLLINLMHHCSIKRFFLNYRRQTFVCFAHPLCT